MALRTGIGVSPPMSAERALVMVSQRSSRSTRLASRSTPGADRVDDLDAAGAADAAGSALPQDSFAQNSIANRACADMSTVSSKTTTPPCPSIAPAAARLCSPAGGRAGRPAGRPQRPTDLDGADRPARPGPAAVAFDELADGQAELGLDDPAPGDIAAELEDLGAVRAVRPQCGVCRPRRRRDHGDRRQG